MLSDNVIVLAKEAQTAATTEEQYKDKGGYMPPFFI